MGKSTTIGEESRMLRLQLVRTLALILGGFLSLTSAAAITCHADPDGDSTAITIRAMPSERSPILESVPSAAVANLTKLNARAERKGDWVQVAHGPVKGWVKGGRLICPVSSEEARAIIEPVGSRALQALRSRDMASLAGLVHPVKGVRFSPYSFIDAKADERLTGKEIRRALIDQRVRKWGTYDGSGKPIRLTFSNYYKRFIYDREFAGKSTVTYNADPAVRGNTKDNSRAEYPSGIVVEAFVPGSAPEREGSDYRSLRLIFEQHLGAWYLVHVVHDQWTI
jgi:hypothetical protein